MIPLRTLALAVALIGAGAAPAGAVAPARGPQLAFASLERTGCFGPCPVYRVDVLGDGTVVYEGGRFVKHKGRRLGKLDPARLAELERAFEAAGFFALEDAYAAGVVDGASAVTAYATATRSKRVQRSLARGEAPAALVRLERELARLVGLERWIGTEAERDALARRRPFADDTILRCTTEAGKYRGTFVLDELGGATLQARRGEERFGCRLAVEELSYAPDAVVGNATLRMTPVECRGAGGTFQDPSLQRNMSLVVKLFGARRVGDLAWITYAQPSPCALERFDEAGVRDAATDFDERRRLPPGPPAPAAGARLGGALIDAIDRGDVELVRRLLRYGPPLDARDADGLTALGHAEVSARRGAAPATDVVTLLTKAGADPSASRYELRVGGRSVVLDHRTMTTPGCRVPPEEPACDVTRALPRASTLKLDLRGGANPGSLVCDRIGGDTVVARHADGDEDALCVFPDGSLVLAARLYEIALQNDLKER